MLAGEKVGKGSGVGEKRVWFQGAVLGAWCLVLGRFVAEGLMG